MGVEGKVFDACGGGEEGLFVFLLTVMLSVIFFKFCNKKSGGNLSISSPISDL